jgi:hypothetical protein
MSLLESSWGDMLFLESSCEDVIVGEQLGRRYCWRAAGETSLSESSWGDVIVEYNLLFI